MTCNKWYKKLVQRTKFGISCSMKKGLENFVHKISNGLESSYLQSYLNNRTEF